MKKSLIIAGVVLIAIVIFIVARALQNRNDPRFVTAPVQYSDINSTIQETGTINPVNQVNVGTQVSGTIQALYVDYNSIVRSGQVLAKLDPTSFQATTDQAHANLDAARAQAAAGASIVNQNAAAAENTVANAGQLAANVNVAQANVQKAAALEALSRVTLTRDRTLLSQGYISQSQFDADAANDASNQQGFRAAQAALTAAQLQATGGSAQVVGARAQEITSQNQAGAAQAQVAMASAQAEQADYNLSRTVITSPIDGIVVSRNVSIGQTVAASLQTPTLFVIASSLKDMEVDVSVDEADVGQLRKGQTAYISVPAFPNVTFKGVVRQVRVNPINVQNVVTYDAVVTVHDEQERLKPGMTANVTINVVHRHNVLTVPMAALLYRPSGQRGARNAGAGGNSSTASSGTSASPNASPPPVAGAPGSHVTLWLLEKNKPAPAPVVIGFADGNNVEITQGSLHPGDRVVTAELRSGAARVAGPGGVGPGLGVGGGGRGQ